MKKHDSPTHNIYRAYHVYYKQYSCLVIIQKRDTSVSSHKKKISSQKLVSI